MIVSDRFDPSDTNAALEAAEDALCLAVTMLQWRAASWPSDPTLSDGGWSDQCARIIQKYGVAEQIPALYRAPVAALPMRGRRGRSRSQHLF